MGECYKQLTQQTYESKYWDDKEEVLKGTYCKSVQS